MKHLVVFVLIFISATAFGQPKTYYVSATGNDQNNGLSAATPWKTIKRLSPGSTYLLKRGDTLYFSLPKLPDNKNKITIDAYGTGSNPVISLYKKIKQASWQKAEGNTWRVDLTKPGNVTGFTDTTDTNVGFIKVGNEIKGVKRTNEFLLKNAWDFYSDNQFLYVYTNEAPDKLGVSIFCNANISIIRLSSNMTIRNISLTGTGGHGIKGENVHDVTIEGVDITEVGGSYLPGFGDGKVRYGNGIEFWSSASDCLVSGCKVENAYDVAYTMQSTDPKSTFSNVVFTGNEANDNEQSFEFWVKDKNGAFKNCKFINNICTNAGYGWSHTIRPYPQGVHLLCYFNSGDLSGLTIAYNTFKNARNGYINIPSDIPKANMFNSDNNKIYLNKNTPVMSHGIQKTKVIWDDFRNSINIEAHSMFSNSQ